MNGIKPFFFTLFVLVFAGTSLAQINLSGGSGLPNVQTAWGLDPGTLIMNSNARLYGASATPAGRSSFTVWDVNGRLNFSYGLSKHLEISATPVVYQDANLPSNKVSAPHEVFLSTKFGSFTSPGRTLTYGVAASARIPTGDAQNVAFERYASEGVGWGLSGLLSYSNDPLYPTDATNFHMNLGYWNHNDVGSELVGSGATAITPDKVSQELLYGVGLQIPRETMAFTLEIHGNAFLKKPPAAAYSRENYLYFTPGVSYQPVKWVSLNLGIDLRLINTGDETTYAAGTPGADRTLPGSQPNYPGWRINFGTSFNLLQATAHRDSEREMLMRKAESRRELFEEIVREQRDTESAEAELERIRAERIRAEKELERLRRILEDETPSATEDEKEK